MPHLEKNLSALAARFPALAAQVAATALNDFQPAKGSDGTLTYARIALSDDKKKIQWLGHTSMPAAGAPHVIKSLDPISNGQNGLGLSVGTGFEWAAFVERLPRAQMVYVYEPDLATLKMALDVCDLASHLRDGRIVLLAGASEAAAHQLAEFLGQNLGFDPPAVLHPLPTLMVEQRNAFLSAGEAIVRHGMMERQGLLNALHEKLMAALRECQPSGTTPAAAASAVGFLLTPRHRLERPIQGQIPQLAAPPIYLDHHASASLALRFQMLSAQASRGAVAIKSDLFRAQLPHIPAEIPLETWVPPLIGPGFWERVPAEAAFGPRDTVIVHHAHHAGVLRQRGIAESRLRLLPLTMSPPMPGANSAGTRAAMVAELPPSDPGSLGIQLPTHLAVFAAARELIAEDYLAVHPAMTGDILRRALSRAGIDPAV
ncbi:MAG TPA: hypothetical protein VHM90_17835, partial [Phycisphaerae bacterium]|nr:hypothetical protein [Phycisphaerae bacterium]